MNGLSMKHLRYFEALARLGHFGRAAEACNITQPALSMQIRELEGLVGAPLVERGARQFRLTRLGEAFASRTRDILRGVEDLEGLVRASRAPFSGPLRIGMIPTIAPYLLPDVVAGLTREHPGLDLRPREAVTATLLADLIDGRLDMALVALPVSEPALEECPLFEEDFVLVRPLADAGRPVPGAEGLAAMRLLLLEEGHCFRDQALSFCKRTGAPRDLMEGSSLATLVQMVGAGIGVTLIPEMAVAVEARAAAVSLARLAPPGPRRRIGMVWRRSDALRDNWRQLAGLVGGIGQMRIGAAAQVLDTVSGAAAVERYPPAISPR